MTEDNRKRLKYYAGEFTDAELNCQADLADYQRAVEEFFLEHQYYMDKQTRAAFRGILRGDDRRHYTASNADRRLVRSEAVLSALASRFERIRGRLSRDSETSFRRS